MTECAVRLVVFKWSHERSWHLMYAYMYRQVIMNSSNHSLHANYSKVVTAAHSNRPSTLCLLLYFMLLNSSQFNYTYMMCMHVQGLRLYSYFLLNMTQGNLPSMMLIIIMWLSITQLLDHGRLLVSPVCDSHLYNSKPEQWTSTMNMYTDKERNHTNHKSSLVYPKMDENK